MLTRTGEYALQAMVYLAQNENDWPLPGPRIAKETGIPQKYLSAILAALVRNGVLNSARGRNGGFDLVRPAKSTLLLDVLTPFEPVLADRRPCPFGNAVCSDEDPCVGHHRWKMVRAAYNRFVRQTSLADVSKKGRTQRKRRAAPKKKVRK